MLGSVLLAGQPAFPESGLPWTDGVGMRPCRELDKISDGELIPWVRGYWTGANLYLGGTDLCAERAHISGIEVHDIRAYLRVHCSEMPDSPIMMSAFSSLRGLPTVEGSRAAACGF